MNAFKLQDFSGLIPRRSGRLLPATAATVAQNTKLLSGELRGFTEPRLLADFSGDAYETRRVRRVPYDNAGVPTDAWLVFDSRDVDVVRSPVINDSFTRYYWAGADVRPHYSPESRISSGLSPYYLGVPAPAAAPSVTPPAGSTTTRAYLYTFVSAYGEEGAPSAPTLATGIVGTWTIAGMSTTLAEQADKNITLKRIYRTVPGQTSTQFFFVAEVALATTSYNDTSTDAVVAANSILESELWAEPPTTIEGLVVMPGGYLVGWAGRRLLFSEPYRPHAWPIQYELAIESEIVSLAVWGATLVVGTVSSPYIGQGQTPAAFTLQKLSTVEPCLSRRGMVATLIGVYYPSVNGLTLVNTSGAINVTQDLLTKEEWADYSPSTIFAAQLGHQYIGFHSSTAGFIFNPSEPQARLVQLSAFIGVEGIETDPYTGEVYLIQGDQAMSWDPLYSPPVDWTWRSKEFFFPRPTNFGAFRIDFDSAPIDVGDDASQYYTPYNTSRFAAGALSTLGGSVLGGGGEDPGQVSGWMEAEWRNPLGGSALYPIDQISTISPYVRVRVFAGGELKFDRVLYTEDTYRLPAGFKTPLWQVEMTSNTTVYSLQVAETAKGLAAV